MPIAAASLFDAVGPWSAGQRAAIGFSGGADSVFLALAWRAYRESRPELAEVRTVLWIVDHGHRPGSAADAAAAAELAERLRLGEVRILQAADLAERPPGRDASEDSLRWLRYACFAAAAQEEGIDSLLLGHQADDQAETLLMRILRGTGLFGLAGIPARRWMQHPDDEGRTVVRRPLLPLRRAEIRARLRAIGQAWLRDPSNADPAYATRNGVRLQALPLLGEWSTGDPVQALIRLQREAEEWKGKEVRGVLGLLEEGPWREGAGPQRRRAIELLLRRHGLRNHRARTADLEAALLRKGSANLDQISRLTVAGGPLRLRPRRDAPVRDGEAPAG